MKKGIPARVNLPQVSNNKHCIISNEMRARQGEEIEVVKMTNDSDYDFLETKKNGAMWCKEWLVFKKSGQGVV